jgi:hypothetical protein
MMPSPIDRYLTECDRLLAFDPALCRRARDEIGAHLSDALAASTSPNRQDAAAAAIRRFGPPATVVAALVAVHRRARARCAGWIMLGLAMLMFVTMRIRSLWVLPEIAIDDTLADLVLLDRALFLAMVMATALAAYRLIGCRIADKHTASLVATFGPASICASAIIALSIPAHALSAAAGLFLASGLIAQVALFVLLAGQFRILERYPRQTGS